MMVLGIYVFSLQHRTLSAIRRLYESMELCIFACFRIMNKDVDSLDIDVELKDFGHVVSFLDAVE